jgi:hypothetical protein
VLPGCVGELRCVTVTVAVLLLESLVLVLLLLSRGQEELGTPLGPKKGLWGVVVLAAVLQMCCLSWSLLALFVGPAPMKESQSHTQPLRLHSDASIRSSASLRGAQVLPSHAIPWS